jgi:hypothetical protein
LLIVTWSIFPPKRAYPERLVLFFSISAWFIDFQGILVTGRETKSVICKDDFTFNTQSSSAICGAAGFFLQLGATCTVAWWTCITTHTYLMVRYHMTHTYFEKLEKYFHIISWTYGTYEEISYGGSIGDYIGEYIGFLKRNP